MITPHGKQPDSKVPSQQLACYSMQVSWQPDDGPVIIKHFNKKGELTSEAWMSPEDVFDYAQSLLRAYDAAVGIE